MKREIIFFDCDSLRNVKETSRACVARIRVVKYIFLFCCSYFSIG